MALKRVLIFASNMELQDHIYEKQYFHATSSLGNILVEKEKKEWKK